MFFFTKMQGTGNDFIILNYLNQKLEYSNKLLVKFLCNRHFGVGADGVLFIEKSNVADYKMRIFNSDGMEAKMCGNGIRCLAKYLYEYNFTKDKSFMIETLSGNKEIELIVENKTVIGVKVGMGEVISEPEVFEVKLKNEIFRGYKIYTR